MFVEEMLHFVNNIIGLNQKKASNLNDAIRALKICCAGHLSNHKKRFISPDKIEYDYII